MLVLLLLCPQDRVLRNVLRERLVRLNIPGTEVARSQESIL